MTRTDEDPFGGPGPVLLDGGAGSELRRRGAAVDEDAWLGPAIVAAPERLAAVHADYFAAGARWATTATFSATPMHLAGDPAWRRCLEAAVTAARTGTPGPVAGALATVPPGFDGRRWPAPAAEARAYEEIVEALLRSGIDALALEMLQDAAHGGRALTAAARGARDAGIPLWLGVSARRAGRRLVCFDFPDRDFAPVLAALLGQARPDAVVLMHTPLDAVPAGLAAIRRCWGGPLGLRPELPYPEDGTTAGPTPADTLARALRGWPVTALAAIGGCCGTRPDQIRMLGRALGV